MIFVLFPIKLRFFKNKFFIEQRQHLNTSLMANTYVIKLVVCDHIFIIFWRCYNIAQRVLSFPLSHSLLSLWMAGRGMPYSSTMWVGEGWVVVVGSDNDSKINVGLLYLCIFQWPQDVSMHRLYNTGWERWEGNYFMAG